jgi:hypothetical protein
VTTFTLVLSPSRPVYGRPMVTVAAHGPHIPRRAPPRPGAASSPHTRCRRQCSCPGAWRRRGISSSPRELSSYSWVSSWTRSRLAAQDAASLICALSHGMHGQPPLVAHAPAWRATKASGWHWRGGAVVGCGAGSSRRCHRGAPAQRRSARSIRFSSLHSVRVFSVLTPQVGASVGELRGGRRWRTGGASGASR